LQRKGGYRLPPKGVKRETGIVRKRRIVDLVGRNPIGTYQVKATRGKSRTGGRHTGNVKPSGEGE